MRFDEAAVQKHRAILHVNPVCLRQQTRHLGFDAKILHDVIHLFVHPSDDERLQLLINGLPHGVLVGDPAFRGEEGILGVGQLVTLQKFTAEDGLIDCFPREPCRPGIKPLDLFLGHRSSPPDILR